MKVQHFHKQLLRSVVPLLHAAPSRGSGTAHPLCSVPSRNAAWSPLDLASLVAEHHPGRQERVFWKPVLVLPNGESPGSPSRYRVLSIDPDAREQLG